jgi:hypothetical protein
MFGMEAKSIMNKLERELILKAESKNDIVTAKLFYPFTVPARYKENKRKEGLSWEILESQNIFKKLANLDLVLKSFFNDTKSHKDGETGFLILELGVYRNLRKRTQI